MSKGGSSEPLVVTAIDFGTTFSGYAFSFHHEFKTDPLRVHSSSWASHSQLSLKTSSTVLFDPDKKFYAFGFDAEDRYCDLVCDNDHTNWYYFRRFKMKLYNSKGINRNTTLEDETGKEMPAMDVFAAVIQYLKEHMLEACRHRVGQSISERDIKWVLTVPAIWDDTAKQFMRVAANKAGIDSDNLCLALEPEAASMFCKWLPVEKIIGAEKGITCFQEGSKYLVLDAGGGTVDITVHEVLLHGKLRELHRATGGAWGGTTIDRAFLAFIESIVGPEVMAKFRKDNQEDYIDMLREFEVKKRMIKPDMDSKMNFRMPISLFETYRDFTQGEEVRTVVRKNAVLAGKVTIVGDRMRIEGDAAMAFFGETCKHIVEHIRSIFTDPVAAGVNTILMVGGFSESPMLRRAVETSFRDKRVIIPHEAGLAVLKGAVIFGHNSTEITSRIAKYTYGLKCWANYDPKRHPKERMVIEEGKPQVRGTFSKLVEVGQPVSPDKPSNPQSFFPVTGCEHFCIKLYASPKPDPIFVDEEESVLIGEVSVDCQDRHGRVSGAEVSLIFGGTELEVKAFHKSTGKETKARFNFLG